MNLFEEYEQMKSLVGKSVTHYNTGDDETITQVAFSGPNRFRKYHHWVVKSITGYNDVLESMYKDYDEFLSYNQILE